MPPEIFKLTMELRSSVSGITTQVLPASGGMLISPSFLARFLLTFYLLLYRHLQFWIFALGAGTQ